MKSLIQGIKKLLYALCLAYVLAWHNVYKEELKFPDDIAIKLEQEKEQEDNARF
ncbi:MAG: hypothetical protein N4A46_16095 [Schleiferiaceae bacterium]|nr:hypothetical protein [Schleiferiaceae bacterium]